MDTYGHLLPEVSAGFGERLDCLIFSSKILTFPTWRSDNNDRRHKNNRENGVENG
jgi:hypothetical protein